MDYNEAIAYLDEREVFGINLGFSRIEKALHLLDRPDKGAKIIHVAGTNGKGSTCAYMTSILREAGYKVGTFTSPHIYTYNESYQISGQSIEDNKFAQYISDVAMSLEVEKWEEPITKFELMTALAFYIFKKEKVDFIILEVGLGGRDDATNVIEDSLVSVITPISLDHTNILGTTLEEIAYAKAGIIKKGQIVISAHQKSAVIKVLKEEVEKKHGNIIFCHRQVEELQLKFNYTLFSAIFGQEIIKNIINPLVGKHQIENVLLAILTLEKLVECGYITVTKEQIRKGIEKTTWKRRLEIIEGDITYLLDGSHNVNAIEALVNHVNKFFSPNQVILVFGVFGDKEYEKMFELLQRVANNIIVTEIESHPRRLTIEEASTRLNSISNREVKKNLLFERSVGEAMRKARKNVAEDGLVIVAGSFYLMKSIEGDKG